VNVVSRELRSRLDPVTLEVIRNAIPAISNEMSYDLQRTSYNMMIYEVCDYSCTLLDTAGTLMSQNIGGVSHFIADMGVVIKDGIDRYGLKNFASGDVLITNHQAVAGQHLNNIVIYTPFFLDGVLTAFPAVRAHWVDVGGLSTGFGALGSTDPWSEGLQLNQLKIYEAGKPDNKLLRVIADNIRFPQAAMGDLRSQIAACRLAERRLEELYKRYGAETIAAAMEIIYSETERKCRAVVETIPDGVYEADNYVDAPGAREPLVHIHVKVTVSGSDMEIDFTGTQPQTSGNNNSRTLAAAYIAYKGLTTPLEPANEGSFRALKAIVPEGCIMMAKYPAAMADWASPIPGSVDAVFKALAPAIPDRIPAGHFGYMMIGRSFTGYDPRRGKSFVLQTIDGGGWGGRPTQDGPSGSVTTCQGDVRNAPIESIEQKCPVIVEARELRPDSAGPGKYRGGLGLRLQVRALEEGRWGLPPHRRNTYPPWGLWGGKLGRGGSNWVKTPEDQEWKPTGIYRLPVTKQTVIRAETTGGGGWGDPLDRDPQMVLTDFLNGYISRQGAHDDYGVVIDDRDQIDLQATEALRQTMRAEAKASGLAASISRN
jgi:N-methylhydantoinase B